MKINLKKLSTFQHIPFGFGFSSFDLMDIKKLKVEEAKHVFEVQPNLDDLKNSMLNKSKVVICSEKQNNSITKVIPPKTDIETNKMLDRSFNWEDSEESDSGQTLVISANTPDHFSNDMENYQIDLKSKHNNYSLNENDQNEILSNDREVNELDQTFSLAETNNSSDLKVKENTISSEVGSVFAEDDELSNLSNSIYLSKSSEHLLFNGMVSQNDTDNLLMNFPEKKYSEIVCSQNLVIDLDILQNDNELITQWKSDWYKLDRSVTEINNTINNQFGDSNKLKIKKKSRWNVQFQDNNIYELQSVANGQEESQNITNDYAYNELNNTILPSNESLENQNLTYTNSVMPINNSNDSSSYDCHSETYSNEYANYSQYCHSETYSNENIDYSQSYDYYSQIPIYSEMKTIEDDQLSPVDYSIYENYNPTYDLHDDYDMYKSLDTSHQPMVDDTSSSIQVSYN